MSRHSFQAWAQTAEHRNESAPPYVPVAEEALAWVIIAAVIYLGALGPCLAAASLPTVTCWGISWIPPRPIWCSVI